MFLILSHTTSSVAQNFELKISSKDTRNTSLIETIKFNSIHFDENSIIKEADSISKNLVLLGYLNNHYNIDKKDSVYHCVYSLNNKIDSIRIHYSNKFPDKPILDKISLNYNALYFDLAINKVEPSLILVNNYIENMGYPFAHISLSNL